MIKILIVDETADRALRIIDQLGSGEVQATIITHTDKAKLNLMNNEYDLVFLGDTLKGGDTYDVALSMKSSRRNKKTPIVCIGRHVQRANRLANLLGSHRSMIVNTNMQEEINLASDLITDSFNKKFESEID